MACFVFQTIDIGYNCVRICARREAELKEAIRVRICDGWEAGLNGVNSIASLVPPQEVRFVPSFVKIL